MNDTYAILDINNLAHRNWHAMQAFPEKDRVVYGILRDVVTVTQVLQTTKLLFCFDGGESLRTLDYPEYKANHVHDGKYHAVNRQVAKLLTATLPEVGFRNLYSVPGLEADDLVALLAAQVGEAVVVANDHDYYQLLRPGLTIWDPISKCTVSQDSIMLKYGVTPAQYRQAKAISGCRSDNVRGVVGEAAALSYVLGKMPATHKKYRLIESSRDVIALNLRLVTIPYERAFRPYLPVERDEATRGSWFRVCSKLSVPHLADRCPL